MTIVYEDLQEVKKATKLAQNFVEEVLNILLCAIFYFRCFVIDFIIKHFGRLNQRRAKLSIFQETRLGW